MSGYSTPEDIQAMKKEAIAKAEREQEKKERTDISFTNSNGQSLNRKQRRALRSKLIKAGLVKR